ncbi:putative transcription repressor MYB4-like [Capsicum annuum]|nr:putative transcription repressor MYB4-like [Capsicum annuum]
MASRHESEFSSSSSSLPKTRWWSKETVAIVTGANKGIGFAIVKRMAELGLTVILTARNNARGMEAVESLNKLGLHVYYHQLDVSDASSIKAFNSWFANNFSALDILVSFLAPLSFLVLLVYVNVVLKKRKPPTSEIYFGWEEVESYK